MRFTRLAAATTLLALALSAPALARNPAAQERADIENLAYRYIFALDWRDPETYAGTFAPDGVLFYGGGEARGREAIAARPSPRSSRACVIARRRTLPRARPARVAPMRSTSSPRW